VTYSWYKIKMLELYTALSSSLFTRPQSHRAQMGPSSKNQTRPSMQHPRAISMQKTITDFGGSYIEQDKQHSHPSILNMCYPPLS
jgi:DNA-binding transcriptional regulator of glucitol operon